MRCLLLIIAIFAAVQALCVRRTTTTTTTTPPNTTTTETTWHVNLWVVIGLWSTYDPQNVTEVLNNFPKAAMEKALAPYEGGPIINLTLSNNSSNFQYNFIVPYVTNISLCYFNTAVANETSGNVCAVVDYKYCDVECYWAKGNNNSTRFRYTRNKLTATVITTLLPSSPNADSYLISIEQMAGDALKLAEQFTWMVENISGYLALTIIAFSSNSCAQMKMALNSALSTLPPTIVKTINYSC